MTTTTHFAPEEIMAFADGEMHGPEEQALAAHLTECSQCAAAAEQFRNTSQIFQQWAVPPAPVALEPAVNEALQCSRAAAPRTAFLSGRRGAMPWVFGGAAVALATLLVTIRFSTSYKPARMTEYVFPRAQMARSANLDKAPAVAPDKSTMSGDFTRMADMPAPPPSSAADSVVQLQPGIVAPSAPAMKAKQPTPNAALAASTPMIARSVSLAITVKNLDAAHSSLDAALAQHHGYAAQLSVNNSEDAGRSIQASLRIPAPELAAAVHDLKALGRVEHETQSGEEVTQQHMDLAARLKTARETEERFRGILQQRTGRVSDVLEVEEEIERVRTDIETMEAEQTALEHRVDFATVELQFTVEYKAHMGGTDGSASTRIHNALVDGYKSAAETLLGFLLFLEQYGPALLVWALIVGVPLFFGWRRYRQAHSTL